MTNKSRSGQAGAYIVQVEHKCMHVFMVLLEKRRNMKRYFCAEKGIGKNSENCRKKEVFRGICREKNLGLALALIGAEKMVF